MRLGRLGPIGAEVPVVWQGDEAYDLREVTTDIDAAFWTSGGPDVASRRLEAGDLPLLDGAEGMRVGAPIARPGAVVCVGLNYAAHAAESGVEPPKQPVIFLKTPNTVGGPDDDVRIPLRSSKTDWEVELGVVIGRPASYLGSPDESLGCVAGFVLANDLSERTFQLEESGGQWSKGKCCPGFTPTGPWLVTPDEVDHGIAGPEVVGQRGAAAGLDDGRHGVRRRASGVEPQPVPRPGAGRPAAHRYAGGRRAVGPVPLPARRRRLRARDPRAGPTAPDLRLTRPHTVGVAGRRSR